MHFPFCSWCKHKEKTIQKYFNLDIINVRTIVYLYNGVVSSEEEVVVCSCLQHGERVLACDARLEFHAGPGAGLALGGGLGGGSVSHEPCAVRSREPCELRSRTLQSPVEARHGSEQGSERVGDHQG